MTLKEKNEQLKRLLEIVACKLWGNESKKQILAYMDKQRKENKVLFTNN